MHLSIHNWPILILTMYIYFIGSYLYKTIQYMNRLDQDIGALKFTFDPFTCAKVKV